MKKCGANTPLLVDVKRGQLVIRIGVNTLAGAFVFSSNNNPYDEKKGDYVQVLKVIDAKEFAVDITGAMESQEEDGSSPLSDFLDEMFEAAVNNGSMGVDEVKNDEGKFNRRTPKGGGK
jgi:hypothetical protein